jgi:hypothetical protein
MMMGEANAGELSTGLAASGTIAGNSMNPAPPSQVPSLPVEPTTIVGGPNPTDGTAQAFDQKFKGTLLEGQWGTVEKSAAKYGVEPKLVASVMAHESGNGAKIKANNPGGIMDPSSNWQKIKSFDSIEKGVEATTATIAKNYNRAGGDLAKLANIYAPPGVKNDKYNLNKEWLPGVQKQLAYFK